MTRRTCALAVILCTVGLVAGQATAAPRSTSPGDQPDPLNATADVIAVVVPYVRDQQELERISGVAAALEYQVGTYLGEVQRVEAVLAELRRPPPPPPRPVPQPALRQPAGGGGDCYAGPIPAYIVTRESGGNPYAMNPSGAYGCFQIMPYVWSANCADLSREVSGQIECASRISNGGSNLGPWALTR